MSSAGKIGCALLIIWVFLAGIYAGISGSEPTPKPGRYVQFGMSTLIIDTTTGELCDALPGPTTALPICPQARHIIDSYRPKPEAPKENQN